jgi:hypothetical protein
MFGVRVGEKPIYWVFRREREDRSGIRTERPVKLLLGHDATVSGYPPDENYVITQDGVAEIERTDGGQGAAATKRRPGRPRKSRPGKVDLVVGKIIRSGKADVHRPSWKDILREYASDLPKNYQADILRNRVRREQRRRASDDADKK